MEYGDSANGVSVSFWAGWGGAILAVGFLLAFAGGARLLALPLGILSWCAVLAGCLLLVLLCSPSGGGDSLAAPAALGLVLLAVFIALGGYLGSTWSHFSKSAPTLNSVRLVRTVR